MQWREPPERVDRRRGEEVAFSRRARGYLAHSDRVGPGVLLLDGGGRARADAWNAEGFTVLLPDVDDGRDDATLVDAARFLVENWHPRLGVVARDADAFTAVARLLERERDVDVVVLYEAVARLPAPVPLVAHLASDAYTSAVEASLASHLATGAEIEVHLYDEPPGFSTGTSPGAELADVRTVAALAHHLS